MNALFARIYATLALVILGGLVLASAWGWAQRKPLDDSRLVFFLEAHKAVDETFDRLDPEVAAEEIEASLNATVRLVPLDELALPGPERRRLQAGHAVAVPGRASVWVPRIEEGLAVEVRSLVPRELDVGSIVGLLVLLGLGLAVWLQLRPLHGQLNRLAETAHRFGTGDRDARVKLKSGAPTRELGDAFNDMADQLAAVLAGQEELLLAVSHELRTPMHRVRFAIELMAEEHDPDKRAERLRELQIDLDDLDGLVGELLTWGRLSADPGLEPSAVDIPELAVRLAAEARALRPELGVTVDVPRGVTVQGDPALVARAWRNAVNNAVRHAASHVQIAVREGALVVCDDGPGVPDADRERIFDPFVRLDAARTADTGGVGLGLALVARIAARHGGSAEMVSGPEGGAILRILLPLTRADAG